MWAKVSLSPEGNAIGTENHTIVTGINDTKIRDKYTCIPVHLLLVV